MCTPQIVRTATSRRDLLRGGVALTAALALGGCVSRSRDFEAPRVRSRRLDLTHTLTPDFPLYPSPLYKPFHAETVANHEDGFFVRRWELVEHCGTHIDAPVHFDPEGDALEAMPLDCMILPLQVIDISARAAGDSDAALTLSDIDEFELRHGTLRPASAVFVNSGWAARAGDPGRFINRREDDALHFPGISVAAAGELVRRGIWVVGVDTLSLDVGTSTDFAAHHALLGAGVWGIECLANLEQVPLTGATAHIGALKVAGASGGPCRVLAAV